MVKIENKGSFTWRPSLTTVQVRVHGAKCAELIKYPGAWKKVSKVYSCSEKKNTPFAPNARFYSRFNGDRCN